MNKIAMLLFANIIISTIVGAISYYDVGVAIGEAFLTDVLSFVVINLAFVFLWLIIDRE